MINKELYVTQLHRVNEVIRLKRSNQQVTHNNAWPHVAKVVKGALQVLNWETDLMTYELPTFPLFVQLNEEPYL